MNAARVDAHESFAAGEPEPAIGGFAPGGLQTAGEFDGRQTVMLIVNLSADSRDQSIGATIQFGLRDALEPMTGSHVPADACSAHSPSPTTSVNAPTAITVQVRPARQPNHSHYRGRGPSP